jgi:hypothetical protein
LAPFPRLGKIVLAIGIIGLVRLIPEMLQIPQNSRAYALIATMDAVLALATGAAGEGLWHGKSWAPKLALRTAAIVLGTSTIFVVLIVRFLIEHRGLDALGLARLLYYVLVVAFWPYGVRTLIVAAPAESRKSLAFRFVLWLLFGTLGVLLLLAVFR